MEEEQIDALELLAIDAGASRQLEHAIEADGRVVGAGLFADETGPHGVVKFGEGVCFGHRRASQSVEVIWIRLRKSFAACEPSGRNDEQGRSRSWSRGVQGNA